MTFASAFGLARSLLMYYAVPFRTGRLARLYSSFVGPGGLCFDLGAHAGNRIAAFRRLGARVVAVEPQPLFASLLRWLYGRDPQVTLLDCAAGAAPGAAELLISRRAPTVTTLSKEWADSVRQARSFSGVAWDISITVEVVTLDALIARFGLPDFCKIDVEGFELEVLRGLSTALPALSVEFIPAAREIALGCVDRLAALGDYEFNLSVGESHRMAREDWADGDAIRRWLSILPIDAPSGDLYARLRQARVNARP